MNVVFQLVGIVTVWIVMVSGGSILYLYGLTKNKPRLAIAGLYIAGVGYGLAAAAKFIDEEVSLLFVVFTIGSAALILGATFMAGRLSKK